MRQAQGARHTLTTLLRERGLAAQRASAVHMVAFPHSRVPRDFATTEAPRAVVVDRDDLGSVAFCVKRAIEEHGAGHGVPDEADVDALVDLPAGGFEAQVELLSLAAQHEDRIDHLTADQAHVLDVLRHTDRLQVVGGAGSGKTFLALEQARRRARKGERVALLCYSRGLGRYLERVTQTWPRKEGPAYVGLFHDLPLAWGAEPGADDDSDYWERRLPLRLAELADTRAPEQLFDSVVVDEAQDFGELGGRRSCAACVTRAAVGCSCSSTRRSGSATGTGTRRSTSPWSRSTRICARRGRSRRCAGRSSTGWSSRVGRSGRRCGW